MKSTNEAHADVNMLDKLKGLALAAGRELINKALCLYYAAQRPDTPAWAKSVIFGALAYFILPVDAIPDVIPVIGYTDDLGVLAAAVGVVSFYINEEVKLAAQQKMQHWFGAGKA